MRNPRSIIIAVIPANVDVATQEILTMAEEHDREGTRTIGVLTKPDLVDKGAETPVLDLLSGRKHPLKLGWYMVRNLGQRELQQKKANRNPMERAFFQCTAPWNSVDRDRIGVDALKDRLKDLLADHVRRTFPTVRTEILKLLEAAKEELQSLGPQRDSTEKQRHHLTEVSIQFQEIVRLALSAQYSTRDCFSDHPEIKFATALADRCDELWSDISVHGHTHDLSSLGESGPNTKPPPKTQKKVGFRRNKQFADLDQVFDCEFSCEIKAEKTAYHWLKDEVQAHRGFDLGTLDKGLLSKAMRTQAASWHQIAYGFIADVIRIAHEFIERALELTCPNSRIRSAVLTALRPSLLESYTNAYEQVKFIVSVELTGTPYTVNHYFNDNVQKARQERLRKSLEPHARQMLSSRMPLGPSPLFASATS